MQGQQESIEKMDKGIQRVLMSAIMAGSVKFIAKMIKQYPDDYEALKEYYKGLGSQELDFDAGWHIMKDKANEDNHRKELEEMIDGELGVRADQLSGEEKVIANRMKTDTNFLAEMVNKHVRASYGLA